MFYLSLFLVQIDNRDMKKLGRVGSGWVYFDLSYNWIVYFECWIENELCLFGLKLGCCVLYIESDTDRIGAG